MIDSDLSQRVPSPQQLRSSNRRKSEGKGGTNPPKNEARPQEPEGQERKTGQRDEWGTAGNWVSEAAAMEGVPGQEQRAHRAGKGCFCCGKTVHQAVCYVAKTTARTNLPPATWKVVTVSRKRGREEAEEEYEPTPKQQKIGAVETMELDPATLWDEEESDF